MKQKYKKEENAFQKWCSQDGTTDISLEGQQKNICTQKPQEKRKKTCSKLLSLERNNNCSLIRIENKASKNKKCENVVPLERNRKNEGVVPSERNNEKRKCYSFGKEQ